MSHLLSPLKQSHYLKLIGENRNSLLRSDCRGASGLHGPLVEETSTHTNHTSLGPKSTKKTFGCLLDEEKGDGLSEVWDDP